MQSSIIWTLILPFSLALPLYCPRLLLSSCPILSPFLAPPLRLVHHPQFHWYYLYCLVNALNSTFLTVVSYIQPLSAGRFSFKFVFSGLVYPLRYCKGKLLFNRRCPSHLWVPDWQKVLGRGVVSVCRSSWDLAVSCLPISSLKVHWGPKWANVHPSYSPNHLSWQTITFLMHEIETRIR